MDSPDGFSQKTIVLEGRYFSLRVLKFTNGYFVSISEGSDRLGSLVVSAAAGPTPATTDVIPSRYESLFPKLLAEQMSTRVKGIAMISLFLQTEIEHEAVKSLMAKIMEMVQDE